MDQEPAKAGAIKATENARASINAMRPGTTMPRSGFVQKTDAGNGSEAICRVSDLLRSPSPDPKRSPNPRLHPSLDKH